MKVVLKVAILLIAHLTSIASAQERIPIPDDSEIQSATELVKQVFKEEFDAAKSTAQKFTLANRLFANGLKTEDPIQKFAIMSIAKSIYIDQKEYDYAISIIDELSRQFEGQDSNETVELLETAAGSTRGATGNLRLYFLLQKSIRSALRKNDIETAKRLGGRIEQVARRTGNRDLLKLAGEHAEQFETIDQQIKDFEAARTILENSPTDPEANTLVGSFLCFVNDDWERGLPHLKICSKAPLKQAAETELIPDATPLTVADNWWNLSESLEGYSKQIVKEHAVNWYLKEFKDYSGLTKSKVEKRLYEIIPREEVTAVMTPPRKFASIIADDNHEGSAGVQHVDHVYYLQSFVDHQMEGTRIQFRVAPDQGTSSGGEVSISFDKKEWTKIASLSPETNKAAQRYDTWHELTLSADERKTAREFWIKFVYKFGDRRFILESVRWVR